MKVNALAILSLVAIAKAQTIGDSIDDAIGDVEDGFENISSRVQDGFENVSSRVEDGFENVSSRVQAGVDGAKTLVSGIGDGASTIASDIITRASSAADAIETGFDNAFSDVSDFVEGIPGAWSSRVDDIEDDIDSISNREEYISRVTAGLDDARSSLSNVLATATGAVAAEASEALDEVNGLFSSVNNRFGDAAQTSDPDDRAPAVTAAAFMGALFGGAAMMANL